MKFENICQTDNENIFSKTQTITSQNICDINDYRKFMAVSVPIKISDHKQKDMTMKCNSVSWTESLNRKRTLMEKL